MLKLKEIKKNAQINGIIPEGPVRIVQREPVGDAAVSIYYKDSRGRLGEQITTYVREKMNRADRLAGNKKNTVGFALTILQRRKIQEEFRNDPGVLVLIASDAAKKCPSHGRKAVGLAGTAKSGT